MNKLSAAIKLFGLRNINDRGSLKSDEQVSGATNSSAPALQDMW